MDCLKGQRDAVNKFRMMHHLKDRNNINAERKGEMKIRASGKRLFLLLISAIIFTLV